MAEAPIPHEVYVLLATMREQTLYPAFCSVQIEECEQMASAVCGALRSGQGWLHAATALNALLQEFRIAHSEESLGWLLVAVVGSSCLEQQHKLPGGAVN